MRVVKPAKSVFHTTGKSLSVLCATLTWLQKSEREAREALEKDVNEGAERAKREVEEADARGEVTYAR